MSHICQVALCVRDRSRSVRFYADAFGMEPVFETTAFRGEAAEQIQGMRNAASSCSWLNDGRPEFQLEIFQFEHPQPRSPREGFGVADLGYNRLLFAVRSLSATRDRLHAAGIVTHVPADTPPDVTARHVVLRDPDGILVELVEAPDCLPDGTDCRLLGLGLTVRDLEVARADFCEGYGFERVEDCFDQAAIWRQQGRLQNLQTLRLGDMYLFVAAYEDSRTRVDNYRLCDIGIMNFACWYASAEALREHYARLREMGMRGNCEPYSFGRDGTIVYNNDRQGNSIEMMYLRPGLRRMYGFGRPNRLQRWLMQLAEFQAARAYRKQLRTRGEV